MQISPPKILLVMLHTNTKDQAPVVQALDSAIHWINHYPLDNSIGFASVYRLDSNLSGGQRYPSFEQLGPDMCARCGRMLFGTRISKR